MSVPKPHSPLTCWAPAQSNAAHFAARKESEGSLVLKTWDFEKIKYQILIFLFWKTKISGSSYFLQYNHWIWLKKSVNDNSDIKPQNSLLAGLINQSRAIFSLTKLVSIRPYSFPGAKYILKELLNSIVLKWSIVLLARNKCIQICISWVVLTYSLLITMLFMLCTARVGYESLYDSICHSAITCSS